jgi:hypothetical protein
MGPNPVTGKGILPAKGIPPDIDSKIIINCACDLIIKLPGSLHVLVLDVGKKLGRGSLTAHNLWE